MARRWVFNDEDRNDRNIRLDNRKRGKSRGILPYSNDVLTNIPIAPQNKRVRTAAQAAVEDK